MKFARSLAIQPSSREAHLGEGLPGALPREAVDPHGVDARPAGVAVVEQRDALDQGPMF